MLKNYHRNGRTLIAHNPVFDRKVGKNIFSVTACIEDQPVYILYDGSDEAEALYTFGLTLELFETADYDNSEMAHEIARMGKEL